MKTFILILLLGTLSGCADLIPFSSGELQGNLTPHPEDWRALSAVDVIQLETNPTAPYSVKLWIVGYDEKLYVHAGTNLTQWIENMQSNPNVRLLIDDQLFELTSSRVISQSEFDEFADHYAVKYGNRPRNENVNEAYLYRLGERPTN